MQDMQGQQMQQAEGQQAEGQQEQAGSTLPTDILVGMQAVGQSLESAGAPPEILQQLSQAMQIYEGVLSAISGGGGQGQGQAQPEAMNPEGTPMGPQG